MLLWKAHAVGDLIAVEVARVDSELRRVTLREFLPQVCTYMFFQYSPWYRIKTPCVYAHNHTVDYDFLRKERCDIKGLTFYSFCTRAR